MATSRYGITPENLRQGALSLQLGTGIASRFASTEGDTFISDGETWAEDQISDYLAIPLKPVPARGSTTVSSPPTSQNYPREFILAATYWAIGRLLYSEYSENEPNQSEAGAWAEQEAYRHINEFRSRATVQVGGGRRRNPNVHMPPNIAPREEVNPPQGGF
jgi:hypothetical protein